MATITVTPGYTFTSGETVETNDLNLAASPSVAITNIVNADVSASAAIAGTKISPDFGAQGVLAAKLIPTGTSAAGNGMYLPAANTVAVSTNGSERARINSAGFLLLGATADVNASTTGFKVDPGGQMVVSRAAASGSLADFYRPDDGVMQYFLRNNSIVGSISVATGATTYATSSDYRLKDDVRPLQGGLQTVEAISPKAYKWKENGQEASGFIAHELQAVVPDAVTGEKDAVDADGKMIPQGVDASKLVPHLVAAIQELSARVKQLEQ